MIRVVPKNWFSWSFLMLVNEKKSAELNINTFREKGHFTISDQEYFVYKDQLLKARFSLKLGGQTIATAQKENPFRRSFDIKYKDEDYHLAALSAFKRTFELKKGNIRLGKIRAKHAFSREMLIKLYQEVPEELNVFASWLTLILWKRSNESGST